MNVKIDESWKKVLKDEFKKPYFEELVQFIRREYASKQIFPPARLIFNAFDQTPFHEVKVVIIGQDPYHNPGQANGLCFSVNDGVRLPPSLINIFKEIQQDIDKEMPKTGNLKHWSKQGVLLLNAILTVQAHLAGTHQGKGWEKFTDAVIEKLSNDRENLVFILWGSFAQRKGASIDANRHLVLKSPHPSPLSAHRGFFGNKHFSKTNDYLLRHGKKPIDW